MHGMTVVVGTALRCKGKCDVYFMGVFIWSVLNLLALPLILFLFESSFDFYPLAYHIHGVSLQIH